MTRLEDRLREAFSAVAETVRPESIGGLRDRSPVPGTRRLAPLAAAAAVAAVVAGTSVIAPLALSGHHRPASPPGHPVAPPRTASASTSSPSPTIEVPLVVGMRASRAGAVLLAKGLRLVKVSRADAAVPPRTVIAQIPAAGARARTGETITLIIGSGPGASPRPAAAGAATATSLTGVSCADAANCWAVGLHNQVLGQPVPAIVRFSGGTWSPVPAPSPAGARSAQLNGVWCVSAQNCQAAGSYQTSAGRSFPLAERWDGTRWSLVKAPAAGSTNSGFNGVTCTGARDCWAIGSRTAGTFIRALIEHWNGTAWSAVNAPSVGAYSALHSVSCPQAGSCWAAGFWTSASGSRFGTLTEHWNGTAWSAVTTPTSGASSSELFGSSCSAASACMTVGSSPKGALAQRWNGSAWSISLMAGTEISLLGDSCTGSRACMAVGAESTGPNSQINAAEQWNGQAWSTLPVPSLANWLVNNLNGIACTAAANCWAVGGTLSPGAPGAGRRIIEHWNGVKWALAG